MNKLKKIFLAFTAKERVVFWVAVMIAGASLAVLFALFILTATKVVPARGGEYTEAMVGQPTSVNPVLATTDVDKALVHLLFANVNELADKISPSEDGRTWDVRLKQNLTWSDGSKLTSDDLIYTVNETQDQATQSPLYQSFEGVTASRVSELEVQFTLASPYPFFSQSLADLYIIPKHLFVDTPPANWKLSQYDLQPVGSGPYVFEAFDKQPTGFVNEYRLAANPNFAGGAPFIDHVNLKFFTADDDAVKAFDAGTVDGFATFDPNVLADVNRSYALHSFELPSYYAVFLNQSPDGSPFKDNAVRAALNAAVDRDAIVGSALRGHGVPVTSPVLPFVVSQDASTTAPDVAAVGAALDAAGWTMGPDGVRVKSDKKSSSTLSFTLTVPRIPFLLTTAQSLVDQWAKIGVKVSILSVPPEDILPKTIKNRDYQALLFGNVLNPPTDLYSFWDSNERFYPGLNLALYGSKQADQLIETVRREMDDQKRRDELISLRDTIMGDTPAVFLYSPDYLLVTSKDVKGIDDQLLGDAADRFDAVSDWSLKTARALK